MYAVSYYTKKHSFSGHDFIVIWTRKYKKKEKGKNPSKSG